MDKNISMFVVVVVVSSLGFWWAEIRPVTAKEDCYDLALESQSIQSGNTNLAQVARATDEWLPAYSACLKNRGI